MNSKELASIMSGGKTGKKWRSQAGSLPDTRNLTLWTGAMSSRRLKYAEYPLASVAETGLLITGQILSVMLTS